MKKKQFCLFLIFIFIFVFFFNKIAVNAMNTGFLTDALSKEEQNIFISNIDLCLIESEPAKNSVVCFDVNKNKMIAVGQKSSDRKTICVYSNDGTFQYGYTFNCSGDFGIEWDEDNLNVYFVRSSVLISVSPQGNVSDVLEIQNTIENNSYVNHFIHATERTIGNTTYLIRNNMGILNWIASSYSQVVVKDAAGTENVIYDTSSIQFINIVFSIIFVCVFVFVAIAAIAWQFIKLRRDN